MAPRGGVTVELFGAKFSIALGAWKLRFVLMLEDAEDACPAPHKTNVVECEGAKNLNFPSFTL